VQPLQSRTVQLHSQARLQAESDDTSGTSAVGSAGDVDGDGLADVLVGSEDFLGGGGAWLFLGPLTGQHSLSEADARLVGGGSTGAMM